MLSKLTEQLEWLALRTRPDMAISLVSSIPHSLFTNLQLMRFRETLRVAARSPFYAAEFKKRNIDVRKIRHPEQLGDFYTTGKDLVTHGPEAFVVGRADTAFETTGTTSGVPKTVFFSHRELNAMGRTSALGLYQLGLRREDVVLSAFDVSFWVSPAVLRTALQYLGCFHVEAGKIPPLEFYERAKRYRPNVIFGEPSWLARFSRIAAVEGTWPVKFLSAGRENIAEETRIEVERIWNADYYLNYGQTESFGVIGVECSEKSGYHRNDLNFLFEIVDPDTAGQGELVYTTLTREVMPLIRYRSSDITSLVDDPCPCGLFIGRIAKIVGRCDEMIVCGMGNISPWIFSEILRDVATVTDEWQVRVWQEAETDVVELRVETEPTNNGHTPHSVEQDIRQNLARLFPDFWNNLQMKLFDFRVTTMPRMSLRTSKSFICRLFQKSGN